MLNRRAWHKQEEMRMPTRRQRPYAGSALAAARAKVASTARSQDRSQNREARKTFAELKIADCIRRELGQAPPLDGDQLDRLASLLRSAPVG